MTTIIVIEDSQELRDDIVEMLTLEGYEAFGAENGLVGVELVKEKKPNLIVCDIMMPELDGYGVLEAIREEHETAMIPLIFLTAKTDRVNVRHGMVLGADDYLTKPFLVTELLDSIRSQLKKRTDLNETVNRRLDELRENIITALPHELRTPLNTIIGFSDMLVMEAQRLKPDQVADWANHINSAAHRLYRLVENYLYYVRMQVASYSEEAKAEFENARLSSVNSHIETQAIKVAAQIKRFDDLILEVESIDELQIAQQDLIKIVDELLDNAFKFSEPKTPITLKCFINDNGQYEMIFLDEGRGITQEQINHIGAYMQFDRWFYEQQGMGLGLAVVERLIHLYHGEFDIRPRETNGTYVSIRLPIPEAVTT